MAILLPAFRTPVYPFRAPSDIAGSLAENWPDLLHALGSTLKITFTAFILATILGVLAGFLFIQSRWIEMSLLSYAVLLQVIPIVAVAPLIIILVKNTPLALTACATVIALFPLPAGHPPHVRRITANHSHRRGDGRPGSTPAGTLARQRRENGKVTRC
jgi:ABC-type nitrate/sulfonate/bicarbonate transport system permease component